MIDVTQAEFDGKLAAENGPHLVDFWSPICGRCYALRPQLERALGDDDQAMAINVFDEPELAEKYGVNALPVVLIIDNGRVVRRFDDPVLSTDVIDTYHELQRRPRLAT